MTKQHIHEEQIDPVVKIDWTIGTTLAADDADQLFDTLLLHILIFGHAVCSLTDNEPELQVCKSAKHPQ